MTKLRDFRNSLTVQKRFSTLRIGQAYEDSVGHICMKTSTSTDKKSSNCILYDALKHRWIAEFENPTAMVTPLNTEITVC
jgi:hypothetical protein